MTAKPKKKKRAALTVDFVTPYSVEECRARINAQHLAPGAPRLIATEVSDTGRFKIDWNPHNRKNITQQFVGYLDAVENGTRVQGHVTAGTRDSMKVQRIAARTFTMGTLIIVAIALIFTEIGVALLAGAIFGLNTIAMIALDYQLRRDVAKIAPWVRAQLSENER